MFFLSTGEPRFKLVGDPLVRFGFRFEALDVLYCTVRPFRRDPPLIL